jgi:hypothetical protein
MKPESIRRKGNDLVDVHPKARPHVMGIRFRRRNWVVDQKGIDGLCAIIARDKAVTR